MAYNVAQGAITAGNCLLLLKHSGRMLCCLGCGCNKQQLDMLRARMCLDNVWVARRQDGSTLARHS
jgi:hypothetical protein